MKNRGIILTLAYPETVVKVSEEWFSPYLRFLGIGKKDYLRAGHAALVLIDTETGELHYHDFGRYITPEPSGRVRGKHMDHELHFPVHAQLTNGKLENLPFLLRFLATQPQLTHGEGTLYASVCDRVDYQKAKAHITAMQDRHFIRYAAFIKDACNCARFVTDTLIASVTDMEIKKRLIKSKRFTPSTVGNVVLANTGNQVYQVSPTGEIGTFTTSVWQLNRRFFLDRLEEHRPTPEGTLLPKPVATVHAHAQWLSGIAAGAWFELHTTSYEKVYRFRRISPYGNVDVDAHYELVTEGFNVRLAYRFVHYSNCAFFHVEQQERVYKFTYKAPVN